MKILVKSKTAFVQTGSVFLLLFLIAGGLAYGQVSNATERPDPVYELEKWNGADVIKGELLVQYSKDPATTEADRNALHQNMGSTIIEMITSSLERVKLSGVPINEAISIYEASAHVEYAEPNVVHYPHAIPNDQYYPIQWAPPKIKCPDAWTKYKGNPNYVVAVIDSGVDMDHPDLKNKYAYGYDFYQGDPIPEDNTHGHGSQCIGICAAQTNNGIGVAGISWDCKYAAYRVGEYYMSTSAITSSIYDAITKGAHVISMSFGSHTPTSSIQNALLAANNNGVVCVASAGNDGNQTVNFPAGFANVIAVAASSSTDQRCSFSNYGSWVDVAAPGKNIYTATKHMKYLYMDGTSASCPVVAGMAVYLYAKLGSGRNKTNGDLIRATIENSCAYIGAWVIHGRVDLDRALTDLIGSLQPPLITTITPANVQAFQGGVITISGSNFTGATQVLSGGNIIKPPDFTVVSDNTITFQAPNALGFGITPVTVTNPAGSAIPKSFTYIETNPPKLTCPALTGAAEQYAWTCGAGSMDGFIIIIAPNSGTFNFKGWSVISAFSIIWLDYLNLAGIGELEVTIPAGFAGVQFFSQVLIWDSKFAGATNIKPTLILK